MKAADLFDFNKITNAEVLECSHTTIAKATSFENLTDWVANYKHEPLQYLADERLQRRETLRNVFPEFETAFVFLFSYAKTSKALESHYSAATWNRLKLASYVLGFEGLDYHIYLLNVLNELKLQLQQKFPNINIKHSLDIQPVLERDLAQRAGLGWFGKNSMLINRDGGSFFIIGSLLTDKKFDLETKSLETDHCGSCTDCITACPTDAIDVNTRTLVANKCISTYTIEAFKKDWMEVPPLMESANGEFFGCDICQDVCPWNKKYLNKLPNETLSSFIKPENQIVIDFFLTRPIEEIHQELSEMSNKKFEKLFASTPLARTRRSGLLKNIEFWQKHIKASGDL